MEIDLDEVMAATEIEIIEMSSQAESARQRLREKRAAVQLAIAELDKTHEERYAEIEVRLEALRKNKTEEQIMKLRNLPEIQVLLKKSWEVSNDSFNTARRIIESLKDVVDLMAEVNHHDKASQRAQVAKLEQERDEREKKAYSLQLQLQEAMEVDASYRVHVAILEQQLQERANKAKEVEESLRFQLHEAMMNWRCLHSQVAKLDEEKLGKDLPFHKFI